MTATNDRDFVLNAKSPVTIKLIDGETAICEFSKRDKFIESMSPFDFECRMNASSTPSVKEYVSFITQQILSWSDLCAGQVQSVVEKLNTHSSDVLKYCEFPSTIYIVLTNGCDEAKAAYCRNDNLIILPLSVDKENNPVGDLASLTSGHDWNSTIKHELFHIWSRNNIQLRDIMYKIIGYSRTEEICIPKDLINLKITNPDACITEHWISLKRLCNDDPVNVAPVLIASSEYVVELEPNFFKYVNKFFVVLDDEFNSTEELLSYDDVVGLRDKIGNNTNYIIHPEEVLADNFVLLLDNCTDAPDQWILDQMTKILRAEYTVNELC
ncbi:MAG: hypothetical protein Terrestrivirus2_214 [Terrestrivirus sp.]|uniref:Uncharacterized protein n=1 Tax=Terrestrivirus sp. TaxID=2487775 RepID=A0A3G4ZLJ4_9VIRU|nr:MAG: hypothetical protein Terrestrivirus2_214 [Terrestrivirus sp.]